MPTDQPAWAPDLVDLAGLAHMLSVGKKQASRLLSAGRLPGADANVSVTGSSKGRRWIRSRVVAWLASGRRASL